MRRLAVLLAAATVAAVMIAFTASSASAISLDRSNVYTFADEPGEPIVFDARLSGQPAVALSPDGRTAAYAAQGGILIWATDSRRLIAKALPAQSSRGFGVAMSPDGRRLAFTPAGGLTQGEVWDITGPVPRQLEIPDSDPFFVWAGDALFSRSADSTVRGRDPETFAPTGVTFGAASSVVSTASPDGRLVAIGTGGPRPEDDAPVVRVYEIASGDLVAELDALVGPAGADATVSSVAFSPDGRRVAAATGSGVALVWNADTWDPVGPPLSEGGGAIVDVAYSRDGRWLVTTASSGVITLRDPTTFQPDGLPLLGGSEFETFGTGGPFFTPDGRYMLTVADGDGRLWDLEQREQLGGAFPTETTTGGGANHDGTLLATFVGDDVLIWDLHLERWPEIACRAAGRNLTIGEWQRFGPAGEPYRATCAQWPAAIADVDDTGG